MNSDRSTAAVGALGRLGRTALVASPAAVLLVMGFARRWITEDAFIDFRVVKHLLAGDGPVFNLGERVEAYSNPLWVAVLTVWGTTGAKLGTGAIVLGLAFAALALALPQAAASKQDRDDGGIAVPLGAAVVASIPAFWDFATSGLETSLSFLWLSGCSLILANAGTQRAGESGIAAPFVVGLGPLIRPDLGIFSAVFVAAFLAQGERNAPGRRLRVLRSLASAAALPAAYELFRMGYFAGLVPNPALAKEASLPFPERGLAYLWDFARSYALPVPVVLLAGFWGVGVRDDVAKRDRSALVTKVAPMVGAVLHTAYVVRVGGDFMHARLLLPSLFAFTLPVASVQIPWDGVSGTRSRLAWIGAFAVAAWGTLCATSLRFHELPVAWGIVDERAFYVGRTGRDHPTNLEAYAESSRLQEALAELGASGRALVIDEEPTCQIVTVTTDSVLRYCTASPAVPIRIPLAPSVGEGAKATLVRANIGAVGLAVGTQVNVVDRRGLSDAFAGRLRLSRRGRAGHEKWLGDPWVVARLTARPASGEEAPAVAAARAALGCGALAELRDATESPLTGSRFVQNVRVALRLHALRIPEDPEEARAEWCRDSGERAP